MKARFLLLAVTLLVTGTALSQSNDYLKHEIYASYGFAPKGHVTKPELGETDGTAGGITTYSLTNLKRSGTINIGYLYGITSNFSAGLSYTYFTDKDEVHMGSSNTLANTEVKNHVVLINLKYRWLTIDKFNFYSRAGLGVKFSSKAKFTNDGGFFTAPEQTAQKRIAWQVSALGVDWSFMRNLAIFAEGGIGMQGCAMVGAKVRF